jgi:hypothetical protein
VKAAAAAEQEARREARQKEIAVLPSDEAREQALAEELMMRRASNQTGYYGVALAKPGRRSKPYQAKVWYRGKHVNLGRFATAEEASLCIARSPEGQAAAAAVTPPPMTSDEVREQALAEGLMMRRASNQTGYYGVSLHKPGQPKPYRAQVRYRGKNVHLGLFATAEEASLCIARSPEGQAAAAAAVTPPPPRT